MYLGWQSKKTGTTRGAWVGKGKNIPKALGGPTREKFVVHGFVAKPKPPRVSKVKPLGRVRKKL